AVENAGRKCRHVEHAEGVRRELAERLFGHCSQLSKSQTLIASLHRIDSAPSIAMASIFPNKAACQGHLRRRAAVTPLTRCFIRKSLRPLRSTAYSERPAGSFRS